MFGSELKAKWKRGQVTFGIQVQSADPEVTNVLAHCGYDFICIDTEHAPYDHLTLRAILSQFRDSPCVPIVRVPENRAVLIQQALDFGAEGILVPKVNMAE